MGMSERVYLVVIGMMAGAFLGMVVMGIITAFTQEPCCERRGEDEDDIRYERILKERTVQLTKEAGE